jgi:hypothetical protein
MRRGYILVHGRAGQEVVEEAHLLDQSGPVELEW